MDEETESDTKKKERRIDLSLAQVAGSALAAAVAAYLAGRLGVYGTDHRRRCGQCRGHYWRLGIPAPVPAHR